MRPEGDERDAAEERRGGAQDGEVGPLALSFDAEMGAGFLEGELWLPARAEPLEDIDGSGSEIGGEEGQRLEFAERIADQPPANGQRGQACVVANGGAGGDLDDAIGTAIPEGDSVTLPTGVGIVQDLAELGQPVPLIGGRPRPRGLGGAGA